MKPYDEITDGLRRKIDHAMHGLGDGADIVELEIRFIETAARFLPGDCTGWNTWALDWGKVLHYRTNAGYGEWLSRHQALFEEVLPHHPVLTNNDFLDSVNEVKRISDYTSWRSFRENPLFREIYRHMDSHYQIAFTPCVLSDCRIFLTWNRRGLDFDDRDCQLFHYLGKWMDLLARNIDRREQLLARWSRLCRFIDDRLGIEVASSFTRADALLLSHVLRGQSVGSIAAALNVRADTLERRLGSIRERMGLENHHQLLGALVALRPHNGKLSPDPS